MYKFILTDSMVQRIEKKDQEKVSPILLNAVIGDIPILNQIINPNAPVAVKHAKKPPKV